jgi:hypothetical protein
MPLSTARVSKADVSFPKSEAQLLFPTTDVATHATKPGDQAAQP